MRLEIPLVLLLSSAVLGEINGDVGGPCDHINHCVSCDDLTLTCTGCSPSYGLDVINNMCIAICRDDGLSCEDVALISGICGPSICFHAGCAMVACPTPPECPPDQGLSCDLQVALADTCSVRSLCYSPRCRVLTCPSPPICPASDTRSCEQKCDTRQFPCVADDVCGDVDCDCLTCSSGCEPRSDTTCSSSCSSDTDCSDFESCRQDECFACNCIRWAGAPPDCEPSSGELDPDTCPDDCRYNSDCADEADSCQQLPCGGCHCFLETGPPKDCCYEPASGCERGCEYHDECASDQLCKPDPSCDGGCFCDSGEQPDCTEAEDRPAGCDSNCANDDECPEDETCEFMSCGACKCALVIEKDCCPDLYKDAECDVGCERTVDCDGDLVCRRNDCGGCECGWPVTCQVNEELFDPAEACTNECSTDKECYDMLGTGADNADSFWCEQMTECGGCYCVDGS